MSRRRLLFPVAVIIGAFSYLYWRKGLGKGMLRNMATFSMPSVGVYDAIFGHLFGWVYDRLAQEVAAVVPAGSVLDVGSGPGQLVIGLAQIAPQLQITGVDIEPAMVERAKRNAAAKRVGERVQFTVGDVGSLPFPVEHFDLVVSTFSMHHWPDEIKGLSEIYRVLKPGGRAIIYDVPDWLRHVERGASSLGSAVSATPFQRGRIETALALGPVVFAKRLVLQRSS